MSSRFVLTPLLCLIGLGVMGLGGCTGDARSTSEPPDSSIEEELRTCKYPRRYIAVVAESECPEVVATRGRWVPSPLFPDAPPGSGACFYTWSGEKNARVDRTALEEQVGYSGALTPSCGPEGIDEPNLYPIPPLPVHGMAGSVGCDVCGLQRNGKLWVVIPPERDLERQLEVRLSNGATQAFQLNAPSATRRITVTLPPPPPGTQYVNGRVAIY